MANGKVGFTIPRNCPIRYTLRNQKTTTKRNQRTKKKKVLFNSSENLVDTELHELIVNYIFKAL